MCKTPNQLNHWQYLNVNKVPEPKTQQKAQEKVQMDSPVKEPSVEQPYNNILGSLFNQVLQKVSAEMKQENSPQVDVPPGTGRTKDLSKMLTS